MSGVKNDDNDKNCTRPYIIVDDFFVNWQKDLPVVRFPYHVQQILYELAINYLISQPMNVLDYCLEFFTKLKVSKKIDVLYDFPVTEKGSDVAGMRRHSVFAKAFDPADFDIEEEEVVYPKSDDEVQYLKGTLRDVLFLKNVTEEDMEKVVNAMFKKHIDKGELVIQQGDDGDYFYVVQSGMFNAFKSKDEAIIDLCQYNNSGFFGELALLYNQPRAASVLALTDGVLWALDRDTFQKIVLSSSYKRSLRYESMIDKVPLLNALEPNERMKVADSLVLKEFSDGEEIITQGDPGDGMYFVDTGMVLILRKDKMGQEVLVKKLKDGDYFGELALLTKKPRACSVVAEGKVRVAFLDVDAFERLLGPCMVIMKRNIDIYEQQLREVMGTRYSI